MLNFGNYTPARHIAGDLKADAATAVAASKARGWCYRAIVARVTCVVDVIDAYGAVVNHTIAAGTTLWIQNHGVQTGGTTEAAAGDFNYLYDGN